MDTSLLELLTAVPTLPWLGLAIVAGALGVGALRREGTESAGRGGTGSLAGVGLTFAAMGCLAAGTSSVVGTTGRELARAAAVHFGAAALVLVPVALLFRWQVAGSAPTGGDDPEQV